VRPGLDPKCLLISGIVLLVLLVWSWAIGWLQSPVSEDFLSEALDRITVIVVNPGALIRNPAVLGSAIAGVGGLLSMRWLEAVLIGGPTLILVALVVIVTARLKVGAVAGFRWHHDRSEAFFAGACWEPWHCGWGWAGCGCFCGG
jgi:hypothetical protein